MNFIQIYITAKLVKCIFNAEKSTEELNITFEEKLIKSDYVETDLSSQMVCKSLEKPLNCKIISNQFTKILKH